MASFSSPSMVDLSLSRPTVTPQDTFTQLAQDCTTLGVSHQDVYGDFSASADTSWLNRFETELSGVMGKDKGMFLPSGVMAQQIALLVHFNAAGQGLYCTLFYLLVHMPSCRLSILKKFLNKV